MVPSVTELFGFSAANSKVESSLFAGRASSFPFGATQHQNTGFGTNAAISGGMVGSKPAGGGLFGTQSETKPSSTGVFGSTKPAGDGLFGTQSKTQPSSTLRFGSRKPAGGSPFGKQSQTKPSSTSLFGSTKPAGGGLFGTQSETQPSSTGIFASLGTTTFGSSTFTGFGGLDASNTRTSISTGFGTSYTTSDNKSGSIEDSSLVPHSK